MEWICCILMDIILAIAIILVVEVTIDVIFLSKTFKLLNDEDNRRFLESVILNKDKKSKSKDDEK